MKVKVLYNDCLPKFEEEINKLLKKGWMIKGGVNSSEQGFYLLLIKHNKKYNTF